MVGGSLRDHNISKATVRVVSNPAALRALKEAELVRDNDTVFCLGSRGGGRSFLRLTELPSLSGEARFDDVAWNEG